MEEVSKIYIEASQRLAGKHDEQNKTHEYIQRGEIRNIEPETIPRRVDRLLKNPLVEKSLKAKGVADELRQTRVASDVSKLSPEAQSELERVLDGADFMPAWFLSRGAELRRTVGLVRAKTAGGTDMKGTGFLVGPRLLLTNFHVVDWSDIRNETLWDIVPHSLVQFDYEEQFNGTMSSVATFAFEPETLLLVDTWSNLDYALVAIKSASNEGILNSESFGCNRLASDLGKIAKGEPVFIIQHPNGQPKQVVLQNNRLIDRDDDVPYLTYEADTERGSSGSPVFNRQWEVVALHHAPEIARDNGNILAKDGTPWTPDMGASQIKYLNLNEGVRISKILKDLDTKRQNLSLGNASAISSDERCSPEGMALLAECLRTVSGAAPTELVRPIPVENARTSTGSGVRPSTRFSRPD